MDFLSVTAALFLIMDPFGNIPVFLPILEKVPPEKRRKALIRELLFAFLAIIGCILCGKQIISFLGLRQESISIAGGIILFLIAIRMIFPLQLYKSKIEDTDEPFIVPLAIPLIVGPSLLAVLLFFSSAETSNLLELIFLASPVTATNN
ncbi:MAG: hypothetical protein J7K40_01350 [candidate division Zixibacteria bacterium]|nr:hypothetical protein [candidate division Zixibacteria bacterium]